MLLVRVLFYLIFDKIVFSLCIKDLRFFGVLIFENMFFFCIKKIENFI